MLISINFIIEKCNFITVSYTIFLQISYNKINKQGDNFMAKNTTNINIRIDKNIKAQAEALFSQFGMDLSTAFNIFVLQSIQEGKIPFEPSLNQPNKDTIIAMLEAERIENRKRSICKRL